MDSPVLFLIEWVIVIEEVKPMAKFITEKEKESKNTPGVCTIKTFYGCKKFYSTGPRRLQKCLTNLNVCLLSLALMVVEP